MPTTTTAEVLVRPGRDPDEPLEDQPDEVVSHFSRIQINILEPLCL